MSFNKLNSKDMLINSPSLKLLLVFWMMFSISGAARSQARVSLTITPADIENIKAKIATDELAKTGWLRLKEDADQSAKDPAAVELPVKGGNWPHFYVDPEEGKPLVPGKYLGNFHWEHHNQAGTKTYLSVDSIFSKDYDGVLILNQIHSVWARKLFALALTYRLEGDKRYLSRINSILSAYNQTYTKISPHNKAGGTDDQYETGVGRVGAQALDESVWLTNMLQGIALIWNDLTPEMREETKVKFLLPAVEMIMKCHNLGIQNISNWYNAAVGMTGYLIGDKELINWSLFENGRGLKFQLSEGFTPDGDWYENAPSYHFYALNPIILLAESARNNGNDSFIESIQKCLDGPLQLMMPDLHLPTFNDSKEVYLPRSAGYYEYGYARFKEEAYLPIVLKSRQENANRGSKGIDYFDFYFLYGVPVAKKEAPIALKSWHLPRTGFDVLFSGEGEDRIWLASKYDLNNRPGWHMHPDAVDFVLYAKGRQISMDPGTADYGAPSHTGWDKATLAHNALVINQKNQNFRSPKSLAYGKSADVSYSICSADSAYSGVRHTRAFLLADANTVVIADWISADSSSLIDVAYHQRGSWKVREQGVKWQVPNITGYKFLKDAEIISPDKNHFFSTNITGKEIAVQLLASEPVSMITSTGLGYGFEPVPCAIARYEGRQLFLLWAIRLDGSKEAIRYELKDERPNSAVTIYLKNKKILVNPAGVCKVR